MRTRALAKKIPGARRLAKFFGLAQPQGALGIKQLGHREYVGGCWEVMQDLQFNFLVSNGLMPYHHLWDIGCGSLRAGVACIRYLEPGHYHGIDRHRELIDLGIKHELGRVDYEAKQPDFLVSGTFEFEKFGASPDFALAQSLFTHLPPPFILLCLDNFRKRAKPHTVFFASFLVVNGERNNPVDPHDHQGFFYTTEQMNTFGAQTGWLSHYIGDWNCPTREQVMMKFIPA
jgi:hypothetical protein